MSDDSSFRERLKQVIGRGKRDSAKSKAQDSSPKYGAVSSMGSTRDVALRPSEHAALSTTTVPSAPLLILKSSTFLPAPSDMTSNTSLNNTGGKAAAEISQTATADQAADIIDDSAKDCSLWNTAYDALKKEEPDRIAAYEDLLSMVPIRAQAKATALHETEDAGEVTNHTPQHDEIARREKLKQITELSLKHMEDKKVSTTLLGHEIVLQDVGTNVAGAVEWAEDYIKEAVKDLSYASIVLAGISLVLPLLKNPSAGEAANQDGFTYVTSQMRYYVAMESLLLPKHMKSDLRADLTDLYKLIIDFQVQTVLRFYRSRTKNFFRETTNYDGWDKKLQNIKDSDKELVLKFETAMFAASLGVLKNLADEAEASRTALYILLKKQQELVEVNRDQLCVTRDHLSFTKKMGRCMSDDENRQSQLHSYEYQALEGPSHIRLIELLPTHAQSDRHIRCRIHHMSLETPTHRYVALSYVWGDPILRSKRIYVNGNLIFLVTKILHSALTRLRADGESFFLWVDAICINQAKDADALAERSAQVSMMGKIYSAAVKVVIDLGDFPKDNKIIVDSLTKFGSIDNEQWDVIEKDNITSRKLSSLKVPAKYTDPFWPALSRLFQRPWFFRTWVIQELALGKESEVLLGLKLLSLEFFVLTTERAIWLSSIFELQFFHPTGLAGIPFVLRVSWSLLHSFAKIMRAIARGNTEMRWVTKQSKSEFGRVYEANFKAMYLTRLSTQQSSQEHYDECMEPLSRWGPIDFREVESLEFPILFFRFRHFKCSDPRDHVYGLLGLAKDKTAPELRVDYSVPVELLSAEISRYMIRKGFGILVLYSAACGMVKSPSWVMNITQDTPVDLLRRLMLDGVHDEWTLFRASGSTVLNLQVLPENDHLVARGMLIGTVCSQTQSFPMEPQTRYPESMVKSLMIFMLLLANWSLLVSSWIQEVADTCTNQSEADFKHKCCRALLAGLWYTSEGLSRLSSSLEHDAFSSIITVLFDKKARHKERALAIGSHKHGDTNAEAILWRTLPGRKLGMAVSHGDCSGQHSGDTRFSWICLLPEASQNGDEIGILCGCPIPFVFRRDPDAEGYQVVGCCYVDNAMDGQIIEGKVEGEEWLEQDIILI